VSRQPRRPTVLGVLHGISERIGATIDDTPLSPRAVFVGPQDLAVQPGEANEWWFRYATCKYPVKPWTVQGETACLREAAGAYREKHREKDVEPALERFLTADAAGLTDAYVVYEVGSRLDPHIVLRLPPAPRREVERYVRCCVVVDRRR
jgi:hypothetical protein